METRESTFRRDEPTEEGFYWATSVRRLGRKKKLGDYGQRGGLRWIVRVFRYNDDADFRVQIFGCERLRDVRDYKDWEGPIGCLYWPGKLSADDDGSGVQHGV